MAPTNSTEKPKSLRSRTTPAQMQTMVDYMASHSEFAAGRFLGQQRKVNSSRQWESLANMLNGLGNVKSVVQWQKLQLNGNLQNVSLAVDEREVSDTSDIESTNGKVYHVIRQDAKIGSSSEVWTDLKSRTRSKSQDLAKAMRQTGNKHIDADKNLTPMDGEVLAVIGGQSSLGHSNIVESIEETQVVFDGNNLVVFEDEQPNDTDDIVMEGVDDELNFMAVIEEMGDEVENPNDVDTSQGSATFVSPLNMLAVTCAVAAPVSSAVALTSEVAPTSLVATTSAMTSASATGESTSSATSNSSEVSNPSSAGSRFRERTSTSLRPPLSRAGAHFSRAREQRQRREDFAMETRDKLAAIQERQVQTQEMLAQALMKIAENDAARLEQEKVNASAMTAMTEAMKGLTRALENNQRKDNNHA